MLLTVTTTHRPATDLGYLLHKSPFRVHSLEQVFGKAHIFYPESTAERCTAALLLEIDSIGLVRNRRGPSGEAHAMEEYVNDRPYVASSFLSVAVARTFGTAMTGRSKERQELAETPQPFKSKSQFCRVVVVRAFSDVCSSHWAMRSRLRSTRSTRNFQSGARAGTSRSHLRPLLD